MSTGGKVIRKYWRKDGREVAVLDSASTNDTRHQRRIAKTTTEWSRFDLDVTKRLGNGVDPGKVTKLFLNRIPLPDAEQRGALQVGDDRKFPTQSLRSSELPLV